MNILYSFRVWCLKIEAKVAVSEEPNRIKVLTLEKKEREQF
jgi:hypothetical protein